MTCWVFLKGDLWERSDPVELRFDGDLEVRINIDEKAKEAILAIERNVRGPLEVKAVVGRKAKQSPTLPREQEPQGLSLERCRAPLSTLARMFPHVAEISFSLSLGVISAVVSRVWWKREVAHSSGW
jgi:hypothetical protein